MACRKPTPAVSKMEAGTSGQPPSDEPSGKPGPSSKVDLDNDPVYNWMLKDYASTIALSLSGDVVKAWPNRKRTNDDDDMVSQLVKVLIKDLVKNAKKGGYEHCIAKKPANLLKSPVKKYAKVLATKLEEIIGLRLKKCTEPASKDVVHKLAVELSNEYTKLRGIYDCKSVTNLTEKYKMTKGTPILFEFPKILPEPTVPTAVPAKEVCPEPRIKYTDSLETICKMLEKRALKSKVFYKVESPLGELNPAWLTDGPSTSQAAQHEQNFSAHSDRAEIRKNGKHVAANWSKQPMRPKSPSAKQVLAQPGPSHIDRPSTSKAAQHERTPMVPQNRAAIKTVDKHVAVSSSKQPMRPKSPSAKQVLAQPRPSHIDQPSTSKAAQHERTTMVPQNRAAIKAVDTPVQASSSKQPMRPKSPSAKQVRPRKKRRPIVLLSRSQLAKRALKRAATQVPKAESEDESEVSPTRRSRGPNIFIEKEE